MLEVSALWLDPVFWLLATTGVFLTGISKAGFAGGAGVVAVPLLALVYPPTLALVLVLPLLLLMDMNTMWLHRHNLPWKDMKILTPAAVLGVALGTVLLSIMSESGLLILLGILSIAFALFALIKPGSIRFPGSDTAQTWFFGTAGGVTSTLVHSGSVPLHMLLTTKKLPKAYWITLSAVFFSVLNVAKLFSYAALGFWSVEILKLAAVMIPIACLGVLAGHAIQGRIPESRFVGCIMVFLMGSGAVLLWRGFQI